MVKRENSDSVNRKNYGHLEGHWFWTLNLGIPIECLLSLRNVNWEVI